MKIRCKDMDEGIAHSKGILMIIYIGGSETYLHWPSDSAEMNVPWWIKPSTGIQFSEPEP